MLGRLNGVSSIISEAEETVGEVILGELSAHFLGRFNSLVRNTQSSDRDDVIVNDSTGAALVGVTNFPGLTVLLFSSRALARVVERLAVDLVGVGIGAENPEITRASVEVEVDSLGRGSDLNRSNVLLICRVVRARSGNDGAGALPDSQLRV